MVCCGLSTTAGLHAVKPLQIKEKLEPVNLFCISLYALPKFSTWPDSMSDAIFPVWLGRDNFLLFFPPSIQLDRIEILPLLFLWICLFHNFSQISHLSFYCSMCCSSALAMCSLQVSERHVLSPRKQALNSNSTFISLIMLLLTSDLRAGFHVVSYPT